MKKSITKPVAFKHAWLYMAKSDLETEFMQCGDEGRDVTNVKRVFKQLQSLDEDSLMLPENQKKAFELLDATQNLPFVKGYAFDEPSDLAGIRTLRPRQKALTNKLKPQALKDRIHGAWLGRCIGCFLGKPIECIRSTELWPYLEATGQFPLKDYIRFAPHIKTAPDETSRSTAKRFAWHDSVTGYMPVDDDTNYTTTGLLILEKHGRDFLPLDVANFWMNNMPLLNTCTAERIAYRNFALQLTPPESATWRNPYREWIGAQIRADGFAFVAAGFPELAAEFAWRDASISHVKNGIYGEMFMAACIAAAPCCDSPYEVIAAGLAQIPKKSRFAAAVAGIIALWQSGATYLEVINTIHTRWDEKTSHGWCHTISNAEICVAALLYGNRNFGDSICKAVWPCFDTDCNGATVGSIVGMMIGAKKIPAVWTQRINNTLHTALTGNAVVKIDEIAQRTFAVHKRIMQD